MWWLSNIFFLISKQLVSIKVSYLKRYINKYIQNMTKENSHNRFWVDDINSFFDDWSIFPSAKMSREEKLNAVTRLILLISILLLFLGKKDASLYILIIGLLIVIVIYSNETKDIRNSEIRNEIIYEGFDNLNEKHSLHTCNVTYYPTTVSDNAPDVISKNNVLVGFQNKKTLIPPPIVPPLGDLDSWKASEWTTHSHINSRTVQFEDEITETCPINPVNYLSSYEEDYANNPCFNRCFKHFPLRKLPMDEGIVEFVESSKLIKDLENPVDEIYEPFVNELQPGIFTSNIDQPILANNGLLSNPEQSQTMYTPMINGVPRNNLQIYVEDKELDVIPRFHNSEYKTLDRAYKFPKRYVKERLPKKYGECKLKETVPGVNTDIKDVGNFGIGIEHVRSLSGSDEMSEYYNRNQLDIYDVDENAPLYAINPSAVQIQIEVTNRFRADMQESLMRKRNAEAYQRKLYPLDTNPRRMLGG